jgi:hypothetical protein
VCTSDALCPKTEFAITQRVDGRLSTPHAEIVVGGAFRRSGWFEILPAARHADDAIVDFAYTGNPLGYLFRFVA